MQKNTFINRIEKTLREADGDLICRAFDPNLAPETPDELALFNDKYFVQEVERVIEENRLSIATANSRYVLRRVLERYKEKDKPKHIGEYTMPII